MKEKCSIFLLFNWENAFISILAIQLDFHIYISEKYIIVNENNNMEWVTSWQSEADIQPGIG